MTFTITPAGTTAAGPRTPAGTRLPGPPARAGFLAALAVELALPPASARTFEADAALAGPGGLACTLVWQEDSPGVAASARVCLPMDICTVGLSGLRRLLEVQQLLLAEFGWCLGLADDGRPWLEPLQASARPVEVAQAMDLGQVLGCLVMDRLVQP